VCSTSDGHMVYPLIAILANGLLIALNGLQLLAPVILLGDLAKALNASLTKAFGMLFKAPWVEACGLVPFTLSIALASARCKKCGLITLNAWIAVHDRKKPYCSLSSGLTFACSFYHCLKSQCLYVYMVSLLEWWRSLHIFQRWLSCCWSTIGGPAWR
jgi:hypothetical protein